MPLQSRHSSNLRTELSEQTCLQIQIPPFQHKRLKKKSKTASDTTFASVGTVTENQDASGRFRSIGIRKTPGSGRVVLAPPHIVIPTLHQTKRIGSAPKQDILTLPQSKQPSLVLSGGPTVTTAQTARQPHSSLSKDPQSLFHHLLTSRFEEQKELDNLEGSTRKDSSLGPFRAGGPLFHNDKLYTGVHNPHYRVPVPPGYEQSVSKATRRYHKRGCVGSTNEHSSTVLYTHNKLKHLNVVCDPEYLFDFKTHQKYYELSRNRGPWKLTPSLQTVQPEANPSTEAARESFYRDINNFEMRLPRLAPRIRQIYTQKKTNGSDTN